jgi:hypothetical protein
LVLNNLDGKVEYIVSEYSVYTEGETFPVWDCIARIVSEITRFDMYYEEDYTISESYINRSGKRVIVLEFTDPAKAMLVKLRGVTKVSGN